MNSRGRAEAILLAVTFIWGGTFTVVKVAMQEISPIFLIAVRFFIAALLILLLFRRQIFPLSGSSIAKGTVLGSFLFLGFITQNIGLTITTASKSAFITGMAVVLVPLLQFIIERRAPKIGNILGVCVVTVGLWLLTTPKGSSFNSGDALTLVCAVFFAIYIVYLDVVSREMRTSQLAFLQMVATGMLAAVATLLFETPQFTWSVRSLSLMAYLTLLATVLSIYVQTRYQKDTTPTRAVIIFSIEPVIAAGIAYLALGEELGAAGVVGAVLIIAGVLVSELSDGIPILKQTIGKSES
jgi:drug/metabolite transporter (DMT)-like permease